MLTPCCVSSENGLDIVEPVACRAIRPQPMRSTGFGDEFYSMMKAGMHENGAVPSANGRLESGNTH